VKTLDGLNVKNLIRRRSSGELPQGPIRDRRCSPDKILGSLPPAIPNLSALPSAAVSPRPCSAGCCGRRRGAEKLRAADVVVSSPGTVARGHLRTRRAHGATETTRASPLAHRPGAAGNSGRGNWEGHGC
jgi:hypothetical protein